MCLNITTVSFKNQRFLRESQVYVVKVKKAPSAYAESAFLSSLFLLVGYYEDKHQRAYKQQHGVGEVGDYVKRGDRRSK